MLERQIPNIEDNFLNALSGEEIVSFAKRLQAKAKSSHSDIVGRFHDVDIEVSENSSTAEIIRKYEETIRKRLN